MNTTRQTKINYLLQQLPHGALYFAAWMAKNGVSYFLQRHYRNAKWLTALDKGVMYRTGETPTFLSALSCFNTQLNKRLHIGALTALELRGLSHYVPMGRQSMVVYCPYGEWFPKWLLKYEWDVEIVKRYSEYHQTGITSIHNNNFEILISSPERAFLECLDLAPKQYNLTDLYQVLETLNGLRPNLLQELLEKDKSVKVKRLFLYMAERVNHPWFANLDITKIDVGKGKRAIVQNGVYVRKYQITIPKDLSSYE